MFFKQFSSIGGLGVTIADFGTRGPVFESRLHLFFFLLKMLVLMGFEPRAFKSKVSYAYPYTKETEVLLQKKFLVSLCLRGVMTTPQEGESLVKYEMVNRVKTILL